MRTQIRCSICARGMTTVYSKGGGGVKWKVVVEDIEEAGGEQ